MTDALRLARDAQEKNLARFNEAASIAILGESPQTQRTNGTGLAEAFAALQQEKTHLLAELNSKRQQSDVAAARQIQQRQLQSLPLPLQEYHQHQLRQQQQQKQQQQSSQANENGSDSTVTQPSAAATVPSPQIPAFPFPFGDDARSALQKKRRRNFPKPATDVLKAWLFEHLSHPYPDENDKMVLAAQTGLTIDQVSYWFVNARKRIWQPLLQAERQHHAYARAQNGNGEGEGDQGLAIEDAPEGGEAKKQMLALPSEPRKGGCNERIINRYELTAVALLGHPQPSSTPPPARTTTVPSPSNAVGDVHLLTAAAASFHSPPDPSVPASTTHSTTTASPIPCSSTQPTPTATAAAATSTVSPTATASATSVQHDSAAAALFAAAIRSNETYAPAAATTTTV